MPPIKLINNGLWGSPASTRGNGDGSQVGGGGGKVEVNEEDGRGDEGVIEQGEGGCVKRQ